MSTLLKFGSGTIVEIAKTDTTVRPVSNSMAARAAGTLSDSIEQIRPLASPVLKYVREIGEANNAREAEVTMGLSFTAEGDLYVVKGSAEVSIELKFILRCEPAAKAN